MKADFPYSKDESIEFYDSGSYDWVKGKIVAIVNTEGYFVYALIEYWSFGKPRNIKIYRDDWIRKPGSNVKSAEAIA